MYFSRCLSFLIVYSSIINKTYQQDETASNDNLTNLLALKSNWLGRGASVLYPGSMKILNQKMSVQAGSMSTATKLPAGSEWSLDIDFKVDCLEKSNDFGVAFWLTFNNPNKRDTDYDHQAMGNAYGFGPAIDGLSLVYTRSALFSGLIRAEEVTRQDLFYKAKNCKVYMDEGKHVTFKVKYRNKVLGVYTREQKEKVDKLCVQFNDLAHFTDFFLSASASDEGGLCRVEIAKMTMEQPKRLFEFVDLKDKRFGDATYTYFPDIKKTEHFNKWDHFKGVFKLYRENSQILAKELLHFADLNQKEMKEKFTKELVNQVQTIESAVDVIGIEARQLEALANYMETSNKETTAHVDDFTEQVMEWLDQMLIAYDKVDEQSGLIEKNVNDMQINQKLEDMIVKSENIVLSLQSLLRKTKGLTSDETLKGLDDEKIKFWGDQINNIKKTFKKDIKETKNSTMESFKNVIKMILFGIAGFIIVAFIFMYYKVQKSMHPKRML